MLAGARQSRIKVACREFHAETNITTTFRSCFHLFLFASFPIQYSRSVLCLRILPCLSFILFITRSFPTFPEEVFHSLLPLRLALLTFSPDQGLATPFHDIITRVRLYHIAAQLHSDISISMRYLGSIFAAAAVFSPLAHAVNTIEVQAQEFIDSATNKRFEVIGVDYQPGGSAGTFSAIPRT